MLVHDHILLTSCVILFWRCFLPSWVWIALLKMCKCSRKWCIKFIVFKTLQPCFYISQDPCPEVDYTVTLVHFLQTLAISSSLFCIISPPPLSSSVHYYCCRSKICRPSQCGQSRLLTVTLTEVMIQWQKLVGYFWKSPAENIIIFPSVD